MNRLEGGGMDGERGRREKKEREGERKRQTDREITFES